MKTVTVERPPLIVIESLDPNGFDHLFFTCNPHPAVRSNTPHHGSAHNDGRTNQRGRKIAIALLAQHASALFSTTTITLTVSTAKTDCDVPRHDEHTKDLLRNRQVRTAQRTRTISTKCHGGRYVLKSRERCYYGYGDV